MPLMLVTTLATNPLWLFLFVVPLGAATLALYKIFKCEDLSLHAKLGFTILTSLASFHLFGLVACAAAMFLLINWIRIDEVKSTGFKYFVVTVLVSGIYWTTYLFTTEQWHQFFIEFSPQDRLRKLLIVLVYYPRIYDKIVDKFIAAISLFTLTVVPVIGFGFMESLKRPYGERIGFRILAFLILWHILLVAVLQTPYRDT